MIPLCPWELSLLCSRMLHRKISRQCLGMFFLEWERLSWFLERCIFGMGRHRLETLERGGGECRVLLLRIHFQDRQYVELFAVFFWSHDTSMIVGWSYCDFRGTDHYWWITHICKNMMVTLEQMKWPLKELLGGYWRAGTRNDKLYLSVSKCQSLSRARLFATSWTAAHQAPPSMRFSRQGYWSGLPFPSPGIFPIQGLNPDLLHCRQILYRLSYKGSWGDIIHIWQSAP